MSRRANDPPPPPPVSISGHSGGPDAMPIQGYVRQVGALLASRCKTPFSSQIDLIAFYIEIGGMITDFPRFGVYRVVHNRRSKMLSAEMSIPASMHRNLSSEEIKSMLFDLFAEATERLVQRLRRLKELDFDVNRFTREVGSALTEFILSDTRSNVSSSDAMIHRGFARLLEARKLARALGEDPPEIPLPNGWTIKPDPENQDRVLFVPLSGGDTS